SGEGRNPALHPRKSWVPAFAGTTVLFALRLHPPSTFVMGPHGRSARDWHALPCLAPANSLVRPLFGGCIAMRFAWIESLMFSLLIASAVPAFAADEGKDADSSQDKDKDKDKKKDEKPVPPEKTSVSHGSVDIGGRAVRYTATAGNVLIREDKEEKPEAS